MNGTFLSNIDGKNAILKKHMIALCINEGDYSIADLSKELNTSIPTITKLVGELIEEGFLVDMGKQGTNGGRRPSIYGLNPSAGYLVGTEVSRKSISVAVTNFKGQLIEYQEGVPFTLGNSEESFRELCRHITGILEKAEIDPAHVLSYGFNLSGRVNNKTGYCFTYFIGEDRPIASFLQSELKRPVFVENDSRAMTYGEYICGAANDEDNMLFINVSWGLGMGMISDGKLSYGKSGFSGEIGHFPFLENNIVCHCGKTGCLETYASATGVARTAREWLELTDEPSVLRGLDTIASKDVYEAAKDGDKLALKIFEFTGKILGRSFADFIAFSSPEAIVLFGGLARAKEFLTEPIEEAMNANVLPLWRGKVKIVYSQLKESDAAILGASALAWEL